MKFMEYHLVICMLYPAGSLRLSKTKLILT